jgi:hypothetical protein
MLTVAVGVLAVAAVAVRLTLRRVNISSLGVTRRVTPAPPRASRVLPQAWPTSDSPSCTASRPARPGR